MILALAGGVGGAKLADGLARCLPPDELLIAVNTGDDFEHLGLSISPDLDTVMYWLAGCNDAERGWGLANESWNFMASIGKLGGPTWFSLGDRDLATHIERTRHLKQGQSLTSVTAHLSRGLQIEHRIVPMSDDPVRTMVHTPDGRHDFQEYFVRLRCEPRVVAIEYAGASAARPNADLLAILKSDALEIIVICPSNPLLSIEPILQLNGMRKAIESHPARKIAISPIVGGRAVKGPAARNLSDLKIEPSALGIAKHYRGLIDGLVIDEQDRDLASAIEAVGIDCRVTSTIMKNEADRERLAKDCIAFARRGARPSSRPA